MNEIILHPNGNTYSGDLATKFSYGKYKLPPIFSLSNADRFHVFSVEEETGEVIHRASCSTMLAASSYMTSPFRVLVYKH